MWCNRHSLLAALIAIAVCQFGSGQMQGMAKSAAVDKRTIEFPAHVSAGAVCLIPWRDHDSKLQVTQARGEVSLVVPPAHWLAFTGGPSLCKTPNLFSGMKFKGIDYLRLSYHSFEDDDGSFTDSVLKYIKCFEDLEVLDLRRSDATDAGLSNVKGLAKLRQVDVCQTAVRGGCLTALASTPLTDLDISYDSLSTKELAALAKLPKLRTLNMRLTSLDCESLAEISKCKTLRELYLDGNKKIDDECVGSLRSLPELKILGLSDTSVTINGLKKLKGLALTSLDLPAHIRSHADLITLRTLFPNCRFAGGLQRTMTGSEKSLLAPLH
jgi:hypothetical protein